MMNEFMIWYQDDSVEDGSMYACMDGRMDLTVVHLISLIIYNTELLWYIKGHDLQSSPIENNEASTNNTCPISSPGVLAATVPAAFGYSICHNQQKHIIIQTELVVIE